MPYFINPEIVAILRSKNAGRVKINKLNLVSRYIPVLFIHFMSNAIESHVLNCHRISSLSHKSAEEASRNIYQILVQILEETASKCHLLGNS